LLRSWRATIKKKEAPSIEDLLKNEPLLKRGSDESFLYSRIPFGIPVLDELTGGGIPKKRITLLIGPTNVGKSYVASQAVASAQRAGDSAAWIDMELSWDAEWMARCGVDTDSIVVAQPTTGEEAFDLAKKLLRSGIGIIVLDSVAGLVPSNVEEESFSYNPMAWQARFVNQSLPKILPALQHGSAFILINQLRSSLGPVALANMPGGVAQGYFSHFILGVRRAGWIDDGDAKRVGFEMEITCKKSKVGGEVYKSCSVPFRLEGGIDMIEVVIREALLKNKMKQSGAWYKLGEDKFMGMTKLKTHFIENPESLKALEKEVMP
jgi:recombination protein RecA